MSKYILLLLYIDENIEYRNCNSGKTGETPSYTSYSHVAKEYNKISRV